MSLTTAKSTSWMKSTRWSSQGPGLSQLRTGRLNVRKEEEKKQISASDFRSTITHHRPPAVLTACVCACLFVCVCVCNTGKSGPECKHCKADPDAECRFCSCCVCGGKQDAHMQLLCDECNMAFHIYCLNPPLASIPDDEDW